MTPTAQHYRDEPPSLLTFAWMLLWQATNHNSSCSSHTMLHHTPKAYGSLGHGKRSPQKKATTTYQTKAPLNEALGTLEASNHSSYQKAPLKALLAEEPGGAPPEGTNLKRLANKEVKAVGA